MRRPVCRFPQLLGDKPDSTTDLERYHNAVEAAVKLEHAGLQVMLSCRQDHYLLNVIQNEILHDAARIAFSRAVGVFENLHAVRVQELVCRRQRQLTAIQPMQAEVIALRAACELEIKACHREETRLGWQKNDAYALLKCAAQDEHRTATIIAAEIGRPIDPVVNALPERLKQYEAAYLKELEQLTNESQLKVKALKNSCEEKIAPIWREYLEATAKVESDFQTLCNQAKEECESAITSAQTELETCLTASRAAIDAVYAPFYAAERALELAAKALLQQMHEVRAGSNQLVADAISKMYSQGLSKAEKSTNKNKVDIEIEINSAFDIDTTGGA